MKQIKPTVLEGESPTSKVTKREKEEKKKKTIFNIFIHSSRMKTKRKSLSILLLLAGDTDFKLDLLEKYHI